MSKKPHNLFRSSDSYVNLFRPYLRDSTIELDSSKFKKPTKKRRPIVAQKLCSDSSSCSSCERCSSDSLHALSLDVLPIWRYSASPGKPLEQASGHINLLKPKSVKCCAIQAKNQTHQQQHHHHHHHQHEHQHQHQHQLRQVTSMPIHQVSNLVEGQKSRIHHKMPMFEVLPHLLTNSKQSLVYQNAYMLDGVTYDYNTCRRSKGYGKLSLDYVKYFKSVTTQKKPTDEDVVFGDAKVLRTNSRGWDNSRIDWLLNLERKQELRKKLRIQKSLPLKRSDSFVDLCCFPFTRNLLVWNFR